MAKKSMLKIIPDKGMKDLTHTLKVGHPERYLQSMFESKLLELVEQIKTQAKDSEIDFSLLRLVKIADGYAMVLPKQKRTIEWADRDKVLVEFQVPHRLSKLGLLPPMILNPLLRKDPLLMVRTASPMEQRKVLNRWAKNSALLVKEGLIQDGSPMQRRKQIFIEDQVALEEIVGTENIAWILLREEYGVQTRKVGAWRKVLSRLEGMVKDQLSPTMERFQKQRQNSLVTLPTVELDRQSKKQIEDFEEGLSGKVKPSKMPPSIPMAIRKKNQALWIRWNQRVVGMLPRKQVRKKGEK